MASDEAGRGSTFEVRRPSSPEKPQSTLHEDSRLNGTGRECLREDRDPLPLTIRRKYYAAQAEGSQDLKVYADPKGEYLVFHARSNRLTTRTANAEIVRDMVAIAAHRGWHQIELTGSVEFRRAAWLEASARGIEARGYEATPLDHAASGKLRDAKMRGAGGNTRRDGNRARSGQGEEAWERNIAERGEKYDSRSRDDRNGRSQLAIIERVGLAAFPKDAKARRRILEAARERINNHLRQGARFQQAEVPQHSSAKVRTADQTPTPSSFEFDKLGQGRRGR